MFALTRDLAKQRDVTEIVAPLEVVQRHLLAAMAGRAGAKSCRDDLVRATVAWGRLAATVPSIVSGFTARGIRVVPIKGVSYASGLYGAPVDRPMTDVDLLVEPASVEPARHILRELGFTLEEDVPGHHASTWVRGEQVLDLHRGILGLGRSRMDLGAVWKRTVEGWPLGAERLDPHDELAFHLLHMARNRLCGPLVHVVDAWRLAARVGGEILALERAESWGVGTAARTAWRFVELVISDAPRARLSPRTADVLAVRQPPLIRRLIFDVATAGSPQQFVARAVGYAADFRTRFGAR